MLHVISFFLMLIPATISMENAMAYEEPEYEVIESDGNYELRRYSSHIIAEVVLQGEFDKVDSKGFFILADYIKGKNRMNKAIPMTAPVNQQKLDDGKWSITFFMPSEFSREDLPEPSDERVRLREVEGKLVAALRYSGSWSKDKYKQKKTELEEIIDNNGLTITGEPVFARYNSPFMIWFLRRNEVLIPVE